MIIQAQDVGWVEVICGPMFSGKTEELIRRLRRAKYARQRIQIFKPAIDDRYAEDSIVSHNQTELSSIGVSTIEDIWDHLDPKTKVIGIDEVQFLPGGVVQLCETLANRGCRVVVAGLDRDYLAQPFGDMPILMSIAEYVTKLSAICVRCGNPAHYSYRLAADHQQVLVGANDQYEARCRSCYHSLKKE